MSVRKEIDRRMWWRASWRRWCLRMNGSQGGDGRQHPGRETSKGCEVRKSLASRRKEPGRPEPINGMIRSHVVWGPSCMVNTSPQIPSSFSPWPPHCKGDQQGCPPTEFGLWQEQAGWVSVPFTNPPGKKDQLGSGLGPPVWSSLSSTLALASLQCQLVMTSLSRVSQLAIRDCSPLFCLDWVRAVGGASFGSKEEGDKKDGSPLLQHPHFIGQTSLSFQLFILNCRLIESYKEITESPVLI